MNFTLYKFYLGFLKYKLKPVRWQNGFVDFLGSSEDNSKFDKDLFIFNARYPNNFLNEEQEKYFYSQIKLKGEL